MTLTLGGDNWDGVRSGAWETTDPAPEQIREAIRALDGSVRTQVTVGYTDPYRFLSVAGGPHLFLVCGETGDEDMIALTDPGAEPGEVELVTGGNVATFERTQLVGVDAAIAAAEAFVNGFPDGLGPDWTVE